MQISSKFVQKLSDRSGNALVMGIMVISLLSMFGLVMVSRMVIDSNISAQKVLGAKAFYLADGGIQMGRRWLRYNSTATTIGPLQIGGGSLTVQVLRNTAYIDGYSSSRNVYQIISTATVGTGTTCTRQIQEIRDRRASYDKDFILWRENVADEF